LHNYELAKVVEKLYKCAIAQARLPDRRARETEGKGEQSK